MIENLRIYLQKYGGLVFCLAVSIIGLVADLLAFYPGFMSPDTLDQYQQAKSHAYGDWHPPAMSYLWSILLHFKDGPQPMLLLQLLLLWSGFFIFCRLLIKQYSYFAILAVIFVFAPFVQNFAGNIWKDVHMSLSWFFASMLMIQAFYQKRKMSLRESIISLLFLIYGCWLRGNAPPGVLPLCGFWLITAFNLPILGWRAILMLGLKSIALTVIIILLQISFTSLVIKPKRNFIEYKLFVQDLSGIYVKTGDLTFPDFIKSHPAFDTAYLKGHYAYHTFDQFWWNEDNKYIFPNVNSEQVKELRNYWIKTIVSNPGVYLDIKWKGFLNFLRIKLSGTELYTFYPYIHPNSFGFKYTANRFGNFFIDKMYKVKNKFYMKPWFWTVLNLILFPVCFLPWLSRIKIPLLTLGLSSFFYLAFEFFVFPADTEFRYFYWNCISVSMAFILAISELLYPFLRPGKHISGP